MLLISSRLSRTLHTHVVGTPVKSRSTTWPHEACPQRVRRGFSLLELMIVIAVAMILTSMLLPALKKLRESVQTVVCASNQRQTGISIGMFAADHNANMPGTVHLDDDNWKPQELMAAYTPQAPQGWDGLGILVQKEYCGAYQCLYCPSHQGAHPLTRYADAWESPGGEVIYTNMHYTGDRKWDETREPRFFHREASLVLLSDGLRTTSDMNHRFGMNVTYGDMSVRWRSDLVAIIELLPELEADVSVNAMQRYKDIWVDLQEIFMPQTAGMH